MCYINIHTHIFAPDALVQAAFGAPRPAGRYCLGVHPWAAGKVDAAPLLEELRGDASLAAVGEIGLDHACDADRSMQAQLFEDQLAVASERGLPVVLHCVRAFEEMMVALRRFSLPAVIFHGFVGSSEQARKAVAAGYYLSLSGHSIRSSRTREALLEMPLSSLFLETDDEPTPIERMYADVAALKGVSVNELAEATARNFKTIFG